MTAILAIDPGTTRSAWVLLRDDATILEHGLEDNARVLDIVAGTAWPLVIEMIASYGMPVGREVFETCVWIGRFAQAAHGKWHPVYRRDVKLELCGSPRAKDANVRQAIIDLYPPTGGGKRPQIGTKREPGPLYGIRADEWAALGVGLTWLRKRKRGE